MSSPILSPCLSEDNLGTITPLSAVRPDWVGAGAVRRHCLDQHVCWREYRPMFVGPDFGSLLAEVDEDPNGILWG